MFILGETDDDNFAESHVIILKMNCTAATHCRLSGETFVLKGVVHLLLSESGEKFVLCCILYC